MLSLTHEALGSAIVTLRSKTVGAAEIAIIRNVEDKAALGKDPEESFGKGGTVCANRVPSSVSKTPIA